MKEQGESGDGSLEPGIGSGEVFVVAYPNKFLKFYYDANPIDDNAGGGGGAQAAGDEASQADEETAEGEEAEKKHKAEKPAIFKHFTLESSKLITSGPRRGQFTNAYRYVICAATPKPPSLCSHVPGCSTTHLDATAFVALAAAVSLVKKVVAATDHPAAVYCVS